MMTIAPSQPLLLSLILLLALPVLGGCSMSAMWEGLESDTLLPELRLEQWIVAGEGGRTVDLEGLRGRPVLLEFWSKDCPPCRRHVPTMRRLAQDYARQGLELITVHVSLDLEKPVQDLVAVRKFVEVAGINYPVGMDQSGQMWGQFDFNYLPHAILIGADGRVQWSGNLVHKLVNSGTGLAVK